MLPRWATLVLAVFIVHSSSAFGSKAACVKEMPLTQEEAVELEELIAIHIGDLSRSKRESINSSICHEKRYVAFYYAPHDREPIHSKYGIAILSSYTALCKKLDVDQPWSCSPPRLTRKMKTNMGYIHLGRGSLSVEEVDSVLDFVDGLTARDLKRALYEYPDVTDKDLDLQRYKTVTHVGKNEENDEYYFNSKRGKYGNSFRLKKRWFPLASKKYKILEISHTAY